MFKFCGGCDQTKHFEAFSKNKRTKDGRTIQCKACYSAWHKARAQSHPSYLAKMRDRKNAWYLANADYARSAQLQRMAADPVGTKRRKKLYYAANADAVKAKVRQWCAGNPEKVLAFARNRRAREKQAPGTHTAEDIASITKAQKGKCGACRKKLGKKRHVDHIIALSKGGSNDRSNLQVLCPSCNCSKGAKDPVEFMQTLGYLI